MKRISEFSILSLSLESPVSIVAGFVASTNQHRHPTQLDTFRSAQDLLMNHPSRISSKPSTSTALGCQLLGMNCATPTDFTFSFKGFCERGGRTDIHSDGWGVAFYEGKGLRQFHDVEAASSSLMAGFLSSHPIRTLNMMSHLRYATVGEVALSNVHPFSREMWGINFAFAMNGDIPMFKKDPNTKLRALGPSDSPCKEEVYYHPVGSTDSEAAFCAILNALRVRFRQLPSLPVLYDALQELCNEIIMDDPEGTILNFLLTCGPNSLWVYSWPGSRPGSTVWNGLHYTTRQYPFSSSHLRDLDYVVDFSTQTTKEDCVSVIATKPLTHDEEWIEVSKGELIVFDQGRPNMTPKSLFEIELIGHGLQSPVLKGPALEEDMRRFNLDPICFQGVYI
jgi:predicted glutamine amidotransferase